MIGEKNFLVTYMNQIVRPRRTAWKKVQNFPQKMCVKIRFFFDSVQKFYLRAKNSRSQQSSAVPPLHLYIVIFRSFLANTRRKNY